MIELRVAGHNILKKWIRERTFSYLRRTFRREDADELKLLVQRMSAQLDLLGKVNEILNPILAEGARALIGPPRVQEDPDSQADQPDR